MTDHTDYIKSEFGELVGKTVAAVRPLSKEELNDLYWEESYGSVGFVVIFTDGTCIIPSADPEGNGAGHLFLADLS